MRGGLLVRKMGPSRSESIVDGPPSLFLEFLSRTRRVAYW